MIVPSVPGEPQKAPGAKDDRWILGLDCVAHGLLLVCGLWVAPGCGWCSELGAGMIRRGGYSAAAAR